jgi:hypothetical protein
MKENVKTGICNNSEYLKIALNICNISVSEEDCEIITKVYNKLLEKGNKFSINDFYEIKGLIDKPEVISNEIYWDSYLKR